MALSLNTVVIAEDNPEISEMVQEYFERVYNLIVKTTDKADKILPLVLRTKASVLIMDLELRDGDATQVLQDVAAIPGLIVIIFTGTWQSRQEKELLENGAQVVMRKPQKPAAIWQQVLNLRRIMNQMQVRPIKFRARETSIVCDIQDGTILKDGEKKVLFDEIKKDILGILVGGLEEYHCLSEELRDEQKESTGWKEKKEIIRTIFECSDQRVSGYTGMIGYHLRCVNKTLGEYISPEGNVEMIQNKRLGRYDSYYRLNPDVFEIIETN